MEYPVLVRVKDRSTKAIKKIPFYVGYNSDCDMRIDNTALNDIHFTIFFSGDEWYVIDETSRNYTAIDDDFCICGDRVLLKEKSIIRAANELFIFVQGDENFIPERKNDVQIRTMGTLGIRTRNKRKVSHIPEAHRFANAEDALISFMNNECIDDVVFFAYEMPNRNYDGKKIVICVSTEGRKGTIKHLRDVCGKTDKISNVEITSLNMADNCEIEIMDALGNKIFNEEFCWTGLAYLKEFESSASRLSIKLKSYGETVGSIKIDL